SESLKFLAQVVKVGKVLKVLKVLKEGDSFRAFTTFRTCSTHLLRFGSSVGSVVPILRGAHVRHSPLMSVPPVEAIHLEGPESGHQIADDDEPVGVADIDAPRALINGPGVGTVGAI